MLSTLDSRCQGRPQSSVQTSASAFMCNTSFIVLSQPVQPLGAVPNIWDKVCILQEHGLCGSESMRWRRCSVPGNKAHYKRRDSVVPGVGPGRYGSCTRS